MNVLKIYFQKKLYEHNIQTKMYENEFFPFSWGFKHYCFWINKIIQNHEIIFYRKINILLRIIAARIKKDAFMASQGGRL